MVRPFLCLNLFLAVTAGCFGGNPHNETPNQRACFRGGAIETCVKGGLEAMESGRGQPANKYLQYACTKRVANACFHLGRFYLSNQNTKLAQRYFSDACYVGSLEGCVTVLGSVKEPKVHNQLSVQILGLSVKACELSLTQGDHQQTASFCEKAGRLTYNHALDKDEYAHASDLFRSACIAGAESACKMTLRDFGKAKSAQAASTNLELSKEVCHARQASYWPRYCHRVSLLAAAGSGSKNDMDVAAEYRDRACAAGFSAACSAESTKTQPVE